MVCVDLAACIRAVLACCQGNAAATLAFGGAGLANCAASMRTFGCTWLSSIVDRPSVHVITRRNGTFTPATSR